MVLYKTGRTEKKTVIIMSTRDKREKQNGSK